MAMTAEHARFPHAQQIAPLARKSVEHQGTEPDVGRLRHPDALVGGDRGFDNLIGR